MMKDRDMKEKEHGVCKQGGKHRHDKGRAFLLQKIRISAFKKHSY